VVAFTAKEAQTKARKNYNVTADKSINMGSSDRCPLAKDHIPGAGICGFKGKR
jgi:hypothetical protein